ncbi:MAG: VWA domain-containing protein, partial [Bacteroidales bacterium]|nr:VWA domain-containing protein [Bacteroidales bacterium]
MAKKAIVVWLLLMVVMAGYAQTQAGKETNSSKSLTRILFVFDASESMAAHWQSDSKYRIAVTILSGILDTLQGKKNLEIGLRVYGPKRAEGSGCEASYMMVPFGKDNFKSIRSVLGGLSPDGTTPIAYSLLRTADDFPPCSDCRNVVILITDGLEACGGDPCEVSRTLQQQGIFLRPFIVGIGDNMQAQFGCMGNYYNASNETEYSRALRTIVATTLKGTTAQINLLDKEGKPTETDVHVTLYDHVTGKARYSFIHTLNSNGLPDTLKLDPLITYDVVVQTIPPLRKEEVWIDPGKHSAIELDAPQGFLRFIHSGDEPVSCIIRRSGSGEAIHVQSSDQQEKYLAGKYDITILTTPRMNFNNIQIEPDVVTQLRIPSTGSVTIRQLAPVVGVLYMEMGESGEKSSGYIWVDHLRTD